MIFHMGPHLTILTTTCPNQLGVFRSLNFFDPKLLVETLIVIQENHKFSNGRHFCSSCLQLCNNTAQGCLFLTVLDFIFKVVMWAQPKNDALNKKSNILGYFQGPTSFAAKFRRVPDSLGDCLLM